MSNKSKGAAHEKKVADYHLAQGYLVERGFKKCAFISGRMMAITKDLFAAFDIVALRTIDTKFKLIQVTAGGDLQPRLRKCFSIWPDSEVWDHVRGGFYCIHRFGGSQSVVDVNVLLKPKIVRENPYIPADYKKRMDGVF